MQSIGAARMQNAHDRSGVAYAVVLRADGTLPPHWPVGGFQRDSLVFGNIATVDALLNDYGLPHGGPASRLDRRNALALHVGTMRV